MNYDTYKEEILKEFRYKNSLIPKNVYKAYKIACRYFGEERVQLDIGFDSYNPKSYGNAVAIYIPTNRVIGDELENPTIESTATPFWSIYGLLIYFPEVTVTNEYNKSTIIRDYFCRVPLTKDGKLATGFQFIKATYTQGEIFAGYMHSHCHIITRNHPEHWQSPCLGTGPIRNTLASLMQEFDEQRYGLFFWELDKVTQVESLSGIPYIKMQDIGTRNAAEEALSICNTCIGVDDSERQIITTFMRSYFSTNLLKLTDLNGKAVLGMSYIEWLVSISKYYMKWKIAALNVGEPVLNENRFKNYKIRDNKLYISRGENRWEDALGRLIVKFKGRDFKFNVINSNSTSDTSICLFEVGFANFILRQILIYINCFYGRQTRFTPEHTSFGIKGNIIGITL